MLAAVPGEMVLAFNSPSTQPFLNPQQTPAPMTYHEAAAAPWVFPAQGPAATMAHVSRQPSLFPPSSTPVGTGLMVAPMSAPVWQAATTPAPTAGGAHTLAAALPSSEGAGARHDQGVYMRELDVAPTSVAPAAFVAAADRSGPDRSSPRASPPLGVQDSRPTSSAATDGYSGAEAPRPTGIDARRAGARYGLLPAWVTAARTPRAPSGRRPRTSNTRRSRSRSPSRQRREEGQGAAPPFAGRSREIIHDVGERVESATMSDVIYFVTSTAVGTRRVLNKIEQQSTIVNNQQRQMQCVLNRLAIHGDMAVRARQAAIDTENIIKQKLDDIMAMLKQQMAEEDEDQSHITEEDKAAWVLDVAVCWRLFVACFISVMFLYWSGIV